MRVTECNCVEPGWCERHQCVKGPRSFELCQRRQDYFDRWERGLAPEQTSPNRTRLNRSDCRHRGTELRHEDCARCPGHVRVKVFACAIRGECAPGIAIGSIVSCASCSQYEANQRDA